MQTRRVVSVALVVCLWLLPVLVLCQTTGKISEVKVYRGQALVTREVDFQAAQGPQELVVGSLPESILPESLYATGEGGISIRSVRFRSSAVEAEPRPEVRALDEQIKKANQEILSIESQLEVLNRRNEFLSALENFSATKVNEELQKGTLNPTVLEGTAKFLFQQRDDTSKQSLLLQNQQTDAQEALSLLTKKRAELTASDTKTQREAVVFLEADQAGAARVALSYLVNNVGWAPAYSVRLNDKRDKLQVEYHAVVTQMSGEDWPDVSLTLSTTYPKMQASAPVLSPLRVNLVSAPAVGEKAARAGVEADTLQTYTARKRELSEQIRGAAAAPQGQMAPQGGEAPRQKPQAAPIPAQVDAGLAEQEGLVASNYLAGRLQNVELSAPDEVVKMARTAVAPTTEGLAVDYAIPGRISLQSRRDQQMFRIAAPELTSSFYYTAVPLLTDYVYQAVEAVNNSEYALLSGSYNAYLERAFAGVGLLGLVARGQSLTVGFGTETRLRAARELEDKTTEFRGGNKVVKYTYRLRLQNFTDQPVKVRVYDRLPQPPDNQVTVTLAEPQPALSTDALYLSSERPRGILRWDIEVPAQASGAKAYTFTYQFTLEFDRNFEIGDLPASTADKMRSDLQAIMESRQLRQ